MPSALSDLVLRLPEVEQIVASGVDHGRWWIRFSAFFYRPSQWHVIQRLSLLLNDPSAPVASPARLTPISRSLAEGYGDEYIDWQIEQAGDMSEADFAAWLEQRLPQPVDSPEAWDVR